MPTWVKVTRSAPRGQERARARRRVGLSATAGLLATVMAVGLGGSAAAWEPYGPGYKLTNGVSNEFYWRSSGVIDNYNAATSSGVGLWNSATGVSVNFASTTNSSAAALQIYQTATTNTRRDYCAITWHMNGTQDVNNGPGGSPTSNWYYGKVYINRYTFKDPDQCGPSTRRAPIVAHEMGHVMGLAHAGLGSLMSAFIASTSVSAPTQDDKEGINVLY